MTNRANTAREMAEVARSMLGVMTAEQHQAMLDYISTPVPFPAVESVFAEPYPTTDRHDAEFDAILRGDINSTGELSSFAASRPTQQCEAQPLTMETLERGLRAAMGNRRYNDAVVNNPNNVTASPFCRQDRVYAMPTGTSPFVKMQDITPAGAMPTPKVCIKDSLPLLLKFRTATAENLEQLKQELEEFLDGENV